MGDVEIFSRFSCYRCEYDLCASCNVKRLEATTILCYLCVTRSETISWIKINRCDVITLEKKTLTVSGLLVPSGEVKDTG